MSTGVFPFCALEKPLRRSLSSACVPTSAPYPQSAPRQGFPSGTKKEIVMSKTCGDTARFHRLRKQKINRRARNRALQAEIAERKAAKAAGLPKTKLAV